MIAAAMPCSILFLIRDRDTLGDLSESLLVDPSVEEEAEADEAAGVAGAAAAAAAAEKGAVEWSEASTSVVVRNRSCGGLVGLENVAMVVALSDFVSSLGSGMTVKVRGGEDVAS